MSELKSKPRASFTLVFWRKNNETHIVQPALYTKWLEADPNNEVATWTDEHTDYGYFRNSLYGSKTSLWLLRSWVPELGYVWQEIQVYRLSFSAPLNGVE